MVTWQAALDELYGFANWESRPPGTPHSFQLARIRSVLAELGDPHGRWPAVHVGGTNGKGSTCAMVSSVLRAAGLRVGLYTSPHLHTVRERIQVDGQPISEAEVIDWLVRWREVLHDHEGLTTFEALTALAFDHFAARAVDVAVVEVGLGGRLDTTRVVNPIATALTPIGLDHQAVLGDTIRQIASDKVGILRPGVPVVVAPQGDEAEAVIAAEAERLATPTVWVGRDVRWRTGGTPSGVVRFELSEPPPGWPGVLRATPALQGPFQEVNAATAVGVVATIAHAGWDVGIDHLAAGLAEARWPARFERFGTETSATLIVDGAHNEPAIDALRRALDRHRPAAEGARHLLLGVGLGKDVDGILSKLLPGFRSVVTARADHPKAMAAGLLAERVSERVAGNVPVRAAASPDEALAWLLEVAGPGDTIVATGSIFLAADVREAWAARSGLPMPPRDPPIPSGTARSRGGIVQEGSRA